MTSTDQAFIAAYQRTVERSIPEVSAAPASVDTSTTLRGPHFRHQPKKSGKASLSEILTAAEPSHVAEPTDLASATEPPLVPAIEVERFTWPEPAKRLASAGSSSMLYFVDHLLRGSTKVVAVAAPRRGVGLTTTTLALARVAHQRSQRIALIDLAQKEHGTAAALGFHRLRSLNRVAMQGEALSEALLYSRSDKTSLLAVDAPMDPHIVSAALARLTQAHDLVLIDAGVVGDPDIALEDWVAPLGGATLLVDLASNEGRVDTPRAAAIDALTSQGCPCLGVIENLV